MLSLSCELSMSPPERVRMWPFDRPGQPVLMPRAERSIDSSANSNAGIAPKPWSASAPKLVAEWTAALVAMSVPYVVSWPVG